MSLCVWLVRGKGWIVCFRSLALALHLVHTRWVDDRAHHRRFNRRDLEVWNRCPHEPARRVWPQ